MDKKISIIVPVYNGEDYIEQTLTGILTSTYKSIEVIIIDDGSSDRSLEFCKAVKNRDDRVVVYTKENGGVASARNFGIIKATGEYICFCDQDDIVQKDTYLKMVKAMEENLSDICMCSTGRYVKNDYTDFEMLEDGCYNGDKILENLLFPLLFNGYNVPITMRDDNRYPNIWNCMFRASFWRTYGFKFRTYINFEDDLLVKVDALTKAESVSTLSYVGYYWRVNLKSETYSHKFIENMAVKQQQCYEDMRNCLSNRVKSDEILDLFEKVTMCKQYLEAIHNLSSLRKKKTPAAIRRYFEENIYERNFTACIQARQYLKGGRIKPKLILPLLSKRLSLLAYLMELALDRFLIATLHSPLLTKIERSTKQIEINGRKGR